MMNSFPLDAQGLNFIETALAGDVKAADFQEYLSATKKHFLDPLNVKTRNPQSRQAVESGKLATRNGIRTLDKIPDIRQTLLASEVLNLDEVESYELIEEAFDLTGEVSAAVAAGLFYSKRLAAVRSLFSLLYAHVTGYGMVTERIFEVVEKFNVELLSECLEGGKETLLITNLCRSVRTTVAGMKDAAHSNMSHICDINRRMIPRVERMNLECLELCECLLYACCIRQRMQASDIQNLLLLLAELLQHNAAHGAPSLEQHATLVLVAIILTMIPQESSSEGPKEKDFQELLVVLEDEDLQRKLSEFGTQEGACQTLVLLIRSTMDLFIGKESKKQQASKESVKAVINGAFQIMEARFFGVNSLPCNHQDLNFIVASVIHQLILVFTDVADEAVSTLVKESKRRRDGEVGNNRALVEVRGDVTGSEVPKVSDSIGPFLSLWASCVASNTALIGSETAQVHLALFLRAVGTDNALMCIPSVFLGYTGVLVALASTSDGARIVFQQLRDKNSPSAVSWKRLFDTLKAVINIYEGAGIKEGRHTDAQQQTGSIVLPEAESDGLCGFVKIFEQVMVYGTEEEAISWIHLLDEDCSVSPCWELLFEAMCCPVPQKLKASLDLAIAALSRHHALVPQLWERLLAAVVVRRDVLREYGQSSMPVKYDLSYQLNEIEARSEEYIEAVAFVELLNSLWRNSLTGFKDGGARFGHFTKFIVEEILSSVYQRSFKSEKERWQLLAKCLIHCGLCLDCVPSEPSSHLGYSGAQSPGEYVMVDLLEERIVFRVMMFTLSLGTEWLSSPSVDDLFAEKAVALAACFQLIKKAMGLDEGFIARNQGISGGKMYSQLHSVLLRDRGHLPVLLDYCQVSWDKNLLHEALQVSQQLISRVPNVVSILESLPQSMDGHRVKNRLQQGFRSSLENAQSVPQVMQDDLDRDIPEICLDIILDSLRCHSPSFAEYMCGFDVTSTSDFMALEDPRFSPTPLLTILEIISDPVTAGSRPKLYEKCLQAIYSLVANPRTGKSFVYFLFSNYNGLVNILPDVLYGPLPLQESSRIASMHQRAWLLHILAVEIFLVDTGEISVRDSLYQAMRSLFVLNNDVPQNTGSHPSHSRMATMLLAVLGDMPEVPWLGRGISMTAIKMLEALGVDSLLSYQVLQRGEGAPQVQTSRGDIIIEIDGLKDSLLKKYSEALVKYPEATEELKEAGKAALNHASTLNYFSEFSGGIHAILTGCQAAIMSVFSKQYDFMLEVLGSPEKMAKYLMMAIEDCTDVMLKVLSSPCSQKALTLAISLECLVSKLRSSLVDMDDVIRNYNKTISVSLLGSQFNIITMSGGNECLRVPVYNLLCIYLDICHKNASLSMKVNEESIGVVYKNLKVLELLIGDCMSSNHMLATSALMALSSLVSYDPASTIADKIFSSPLPSRILQEISEGGTSASTLGRTGFFLLSARIYLLLELALSGRGRSKAAAQRLVSLQCILRLNASRVLNVEAERTRFASSLLQNTGLDRHHLHQVVGPSLRLMLTIAGTLSESNVVLDQTYDFVKTHKQLIDRVLKEAGNSNPAALGWMPGRLELEEANLVVQLCTLLSSSNTRQKEIGVGLHESILYLASRIFSINSQSHIPLVVCLEDYHSRGREDPDAEKAYKSVIELRASLAAYIRICTSLQASTYQRSQVDSTALLLLLKDVLYQSTMYDMPYIFQRKRSADAIEKHNMFMLDKQLSALVRLLEHALACMFVELAGKDGKPPLSENSKEMENLRRLCKPVIASLEQYVASQQLPGDSDLFAVILRRTKAQLYGFPREQ